MGAGGACVKRLTTFRVIFYIIILALYPEVSDNFFLSKAKAVSMLSAGGACVWMIRFRPFPIGCDLGFNPNKIVIMP